MHRCLRHSRLTRRSRHCKRKHHRRRGGSRRRRYSRKIRKAGQPPPPPLTPAEQKERARRWAEKEYGTQITVPDIGDIIDKKSKGTTSSMSNSALNEIRKQQQMEIQARTNAVADSQRIQKPSTAYLASLGTSSQAPSAKKRTRDNDDYDAPSMKRK